MEGNNGFALSRQRGGFIFRSDKYSAHENKAVLRVIGNIYFDDPLYGFAHETAQLSLGSFISIYSIGYFTH